MLRKNVLAGRDDRGITSFARRRDPFVTSHDFSQYQLYLHVFSKTNLSPNSSSAHPKDVISRLSLRHILITTVKYILEPGYAPGNDFLIRKYILWMSQRLLYDVFRIF